MVTYDKALRSVIYHLVTLLPGQSKQKTKMVSFRLPVELLDRLETESSYRKWSKTETVEQALLWYLELCKEGRAIISQSDNGGSGRAD